MSRRFNKAVSAPDNAHIDAALTNLSVAFMQEERSFVASRVFQEIPMEHKSDKFYVYNFGELTRDGMLLRAPATESAGVTYAREEKSYLVQRYAAHIDVSDDEVANEDQVLDAEQDSAMKLGQLALINRERRWANAFFKDVWTFRADGAAVATSKATYNPEDDSKNDLVFWDKDNATIVADVRDAKRAVQLRTGLRPNVMVVGREAFDRIIEQKLVRERFGVGLEGNAPMYVTANMLAQLLELDDVLVMDGIVNTANVGASVNKLSFIGGGKHALLAYRPPRPGIRVPAAGYVFAWRGILKNTNLYSDTEMSSWYMRELKATRHEIEAANDMRLISADCGFFFNGIVE